MKKIFRTSPGADRQSSSPVSPGSFKGDRRSIRGRISGPIPIPSQLDKELGSSEPEIITDTPHTTESKGTDSPVNGSKEQQPPRTPSSVSELSAEVLHESSQEGEAAHEASGQETRPGSVSPLEPEPAPATTAATTRSTFPAAIPPAPAQNALIAGPLPPLEEATVPPPPVPTSAPAPPPVARAVTSPIPAHQSPPRVLRSRSRLVRSSAFSTDTTHDGDKERPQRKKSTLRNTIGRLFGRKRKPPPSQIAPLARPSDTPEGSTVFHGGSTPVSQPGNRARESQRTTSLPLDEYGRALRSHSIGPEDELAIRSARNSLNVAAVLSPARARQPAANAYSVHPRQSRTRDGELMGLAPRPASTHGRISVSEQDGYTDNPDQIGRAITSNSPGLKRRSRSISVLPDFDQDDSNERRRSSDIRYWRESYGQTVKSPVSTSYAPEQDNVDPVTSETGETSPKNLPPKTPPQPFVFGDISSMNQMAGMKITQAVSMDARIGSLERRTRRLEKVTTQLGDAVPDFRPQIDLLNQSPSRTPSHRPSASHGRSVGRLPPFDGDFLRRPSTSRSDTTKATSVDQQANSNTNNILAAFGPSGRPLSTATIRGVASLPALNRDLVRPFTVDHYTTLMALLETERSARQALEVQVRSLSHQIHLISKSSAFAQAANGFGPTTDPPYNERSAFDYDYDDEDEEPTQRRSKFSDRRVATEDSGIVTTESREEDDMSSSYTTPREEGFSPSMSDDTDDDDPIYRKERTLSLSRITMNRPDPRLRTKANPPMI